MQVAKATQQDITEALGFIPADDREIWVRMAIAVKTELGDPGFDIWNAWSQSSSAYVEKDARDVWKSIKNPDGPLTIASLFGEAKANGYQAKHDHNGYETSESPQALWNSGTEAGAGEFPYLKLRGVGSHGNRITGNMLLTPVRDFGGKLLGVQRIWKQGGKWVKKHAKGSRLGSGFHVIGNLDSGAIIIAEGYATSATIHEVTGHTVVIAFDCGRLATVGKAIRAKYPKATILFAGDEDTHLAKNEGRSKATEAAKEINARVVLPVFQSGTGGDFNDLYQKEGAEAVRQQIEAGLAQEESQPAQRSVKLICGADIRPEPIRWLWEEWLAAGKFHVLAGPPGTGKTTIAGALAATLSCGGSWPDGTRAEAGNVIIWSGEDDPKDTLVPRMRACSADMTRVQFISGVTDGGESIAFDPALHTDDLAVTAARLGGVKLLIIDPIVSAVAGDSHKNAEVRRGLQPLVTLAERLDCAVLGISHFSKGTSGRDPVERVTGSIAFGALARLVFAAAKMPDDDQEGGGRIFVRSKSNIGPDNGGFRYDLAQIELEDYPGVFASRLMWGSVVEGNAKELLGRAEAAPKEDEAGGRSELTQVTWLREFLAYGEKPMTECQKEAKSAGFSEKQIRTAREKLGIMPRKGGFDEGWIWSLPEGTFTNNEDAVAAQELPNKKQRASWAPSLKPADDAASRNGHERHLAGEWASSTKPTDDAASSASENGESDEGAQDALSDSVKEGGASSMTASQFLAGDWEVF